METKKEREKESAKELEGELMKYFKINDDSGDEMDDEEDNEECDINPEYVNPVDMFEIDSDTIPMPGLKSGNIHRVWKVYGNVKRMNNIDNICLTIRRNCEDCEIIVNHWLIIRMFEISVDIKSKKKITRKVVWVPEIILDKNNSKCS